MYDSPIDKFYGEMKSQIVQNEDEYLMVQVSQTIGYNIDKDELIKALNYDRKQYEKGYEDGLNANRWIPITRLPEQDGKFLVTLCSYTGNNWVKWIDIAYFSLNDKKFYKSFTVIAWMPLPEPWND